MISNLDGLSIAPSASLRDLIAVIDANRRQIALVVDQDNSLLGVVTDGDIRRAILRGATLDETVSVVMNPHPKTTLAGEPGSTILERMADLEIRHMPVIDKAGKVVALATLDEIMHPEHSSAPIVLMAGGKGQRLYPLTKDVPKPMLPVGGKPIIGSILEKIRGQGFTDVRISVNYLADVIKQYVGDGSTFGLQVQYVHEDAPLGTAGALAALRGQISEPFIVMNSDLITHVDLRDLLSFHKQNGGEATVGVREHLIQVPFGVVEVEDTFVTALTEKPIHRSLVSAGIYALNQEVLERLSLGEYCDMPTLLGQLMESKSGVAAFPIHESWLDVGRPEDLNLARDEANTLNAGSASTS
jgi:dTDP-glucose pyrophosphorylase